MDNRLVLGVLLVTLSWGFMGTHAQNMTTASVNSTTTMTMSSSTNAPSANTTVGPTATTPVTGGHNATTPMTGGHNATTPMTGGHNATTPMTGGHNATTPMTGGHNATTPMTGGHNATTPMTGGHNATTPITGGHNATTPMTGGHNATTPMTGGHNATTPMTGGHNATTPMTGGHNATTPMTGGHNTTTPMTGGHNGPAVMFPFVRPVSRTGCSSEKLCGAEPSDCDPSSEGSCFFFSANQQSNQTFEFELSGQSEGYIALSLSTDTTLGGNDTTYICANNSGTVLFATALLDNGELTLTSLSGIIGNASINIQCVFVARVPESTAPATRAAGFSVSLLSGTFNTTSGRFGVPITRLQTNVVDLANPNATVINLNANTTAEPTAHAVTHQQSLIQVLLVTMSVLVFTMLQRN